MLESWLNHPHAAPWLVVMWIAGLLGSLGHCAGMCGPIVAAFGLSQANQGERPWTRHLRFQLGRITTYALLGGLIGYNAEKMGKQKYKRFAVTLRERGKIVGGIVGEVWTTVDGKTHLPKTDNPKAWPWKNAYHTMEHALVGYITSQQLHGEPVTLYFNFASPQDDGAVRPYFFSGRIDSKEVTDDSRGGSIQKIIFRDVK